MNLFLLHFWSQILSIKNPDIFDILLDEFVTSLFVAEDLINIVDQEDVSSSWAFIRFYDPNIIEAIVEEVGVGLEAVKIKFKIEKSWCVGKEADFGLFRKM